VNIGGIIGEMTSWTVGKKRVNVSSAQGLLSAVDAAKGNLWGMNLFAHGDRQGHIAESGIVVIWEKDIDGEWEGIVDKNKRIDQLILMSKIKSGGYRLSIAYLMQCYSGYQGPHENEYGVIRSFNWKSEWSETVKRPFTYQGLNVAGIDLR
jgi:hypothetical protein